MRGGRGMPLSCHLILTRDPHARFWADYVDQKIYSPIRKKWLLKGDEFERGKKELLGSLKLLEQELGEKPYFGGEAFGLVDIALIGFYTRFYTAETIGNFSLEAECPKLFQWAKRCVAEKQSVFHFSARPSQGASLLLAAQEET